MLDTDLHRCLDRVIPDEVRDAGLEHRKPPVQGPGTLLQRVTCLFLGVHLEYCNGGRGNGDALYADTRETIPKSLKVNQLVRRELYNSR